jgi:hypothetical protein
MFLRLWETLSNCSGTPESNPYVFGKAVLVAAKRADRARSTVFCGNSVLCHLVNGRYSAVARQKLSHSSPTPSTVLVV